MYYVEAFKIWGDSENRAIFFKAPEDLISGSYNEAHHGDKRGGQDNEINLFRVIQEALNNIKMHAAADNVTINMVHLSPNIVLQIKDDGRGFDLKRRLVKALRERRMGLGSMETRISLLDGNIKIKSRPGFGAQISIEVPCKEKQNGSEEKHSDYR